MGFEKFEQFIVEKGNKGTKHSFYKIDRFLIEEVERKIFIPRELKDFYLKVGHGYFFDNVSSYSINKLLDPIEFLKINLREDYYKDDPTLDYYILDKFKNLNIFFEVIEGNYLLIDKKENNGKNSIYYIDEKISDSLEDFLNTFNDNPNYFG